MRLPESRWQFEIQSRAPAITRPEKCARSPRREGPIQRQSFGGSTQPRIRRNEDMKILPHQSQKSVLIYRFAAVNMDCKSRQNRPVAKHAKSTVNRVCKTLMHVGKTP